MKPPISGLPPTSHLPHLARPILQVMAQGPLSLFQGQWLPKKVPSLRKLLTCLSLCLVFLLSFPFGDLLFLIPRHFSEISRCSKHVDCRPLSQGQPTVMLLWPRQWASTWCPRRSEMWQKVIQFQKTLKIRTFDSKATRNQNQEGWGRATPS